MNAICQQNPNSCGTANSVCVPATLRCECFSAGNGYGATAYANTGYYFNQLTGKCVIRKVQGVACSSTTECIEYAFCGKLAGDTYDKCYCDPRYYYYDPATGTCALRQSIGDYNYNALTACTSTDECDFYTHNLRCISGLCQCDQMYEFWNDEYKRCMIRQRYAFFCWL